MIKNHIINRYVVWIFTLLILLFFDSCAVFLHIDRQKDFSLSQTKAPRIISINPDFDLIRLNFETTNKYFNTKNTTTLNNNKYLEELLKESAQKNKLYLEIINVEDLEATDISYFQYLAPLKNEILKVNQLQDFETINSLQNKKKQSKLMTLHGTGPAISSNYGLLEEVYGTPYFALQGVALSQKYNNNSASSTLSTLSPDDYHKHQGEDIDVLYYMIIADVSTSQIVYREYRNMNSNISESNFNSIIYDSFKLVSR